MDTSSLAFVVGLPILFCSSFVLEVIAKFIEAEGQQILPHY